MRKSYFKIASSLVVLGGLCANVNAQDALLETFKITAPDGAPFDRFGRSVAVEDSTVLVGASFDDDRGDGSGSAYLFNAQTGAFTEKLLFNNGAPRDNFGESIALRGGSAIISAPNSSLDGLRAGAASIFRNNQQIDTLTPSAPSGASTDFGMFGFSVNLSDDGSIAVIGARSDTGQPGAGSNSGGGAMYIFNNGNEQKVFASDTGFADNFGHSVATTNSVAVGSSPFDDDNGSDSGAIYAFDTSSSEEIFKFLPNDGAAQDFFGWSVAVEENIIAVGSPYNDEAGIDAGAVYLIDASTGAQLNKITLPNTSLFGFRVALNDSRLAVGGNGSAHIFDVTTGNLIAELQSSNPAPESQFGASIAIDGNTVLVGAEGDRTRGDKAGAVYIFDLSGDSTPVDPEPTDPPQDPVITAGIQVIQTETFTVQRRNGRIREGAEVTVIVEDSQGAPIEGATVTIALSGRLSEVVSGVTGFDGSVVLRSTQTRGTRRRALTYTACIVDVQGSLTYAPETNAVTCARR